MDPSVKDAGEVERQENLKAKDESTSSGRICCSFLAMRQPQISSKSSGRWLGRCWRGHKSMKSQKGVPLRT